MQLRRLGVVVAVMAVISVLTLGATAGASMAAAKPVKGGTITMIFGEPTGYDVTQLSGVPNITASHYAMIVYDALLYIDLETNELRPRLATGMTSADKGLTWTLKLRPGLMFSDGTAFDATAVQFNWTRIADPVNKAASVDYAGRIATMQVVDATTLKVTLKVADPNYALLVARHLSSIGSPTAIKASGATFASKPVGAGPFVLTEWVKGSSASYARNPNYFLKGQPYLDTLKIMHISDETSKLNAALAGTAQTIFTAVVPNLDQLKASGNFNYYDTTAPGGATAFFMNMDRPPFDDIRMRQVMQLAVNSKEVVTRAGLAPEAEVKTIEAKDSPYYNPALKQPKTDVAKAQKLLDAYIAEKNGGKPLEVNFLIFNTAQQMAPVLATEAIVASRLKNFTLKIESLAVTAVQARTTARDFQITATSAKWSDPSLDFQDLFGATGRQNYSNYKNPEVQALVDKLGKVTDVKTKKDLSNQVVQHVIDDAALYWINRAFNYTVVNKSVRGVHFFFDSRPFIADFWLSPKKT